MYDVQACQAELDAISAKYDNCTKLTQAAGNDCPCWQELQAMVDVAKANLTNKNCDGSTPAKAVKSQKTACLKSFQACKKAEDSSTEFIHICVNEGGNFSATVAPATTEAPTTSAPTTAPGKVCGQGQEW